MNIGVKHNGSFITGRVISYQREHRICTGIGTLDITLESTYSADIDPWDTFDIYENGSFQVRYYVSEVSQSAPDGTIVIQAQDKSKRLVDYFIPDSYTIDYPSYTRYWIEKFLDEAGISYHFTTSSQGNLLSNYTALGLQPAYDQIMMLLQLSGWYMYFDGNGIAVIGSLDVDLASSAGSVGLTDILDIKRITNDKMLRNRALVWGEFNPTTQTYAFADVRTHTRWNYDHNDLRTMVISNHNIPDSEDAYAIANKLLKEFARATIEKHLIIWGARNYDLGRALRVQSHVWRGKGLITTFGVNMDRNGLVTNVILDERCPRLFGFFDFGDYVYVGTFGDGVWRKHIKFDPTFYNFSTGLTNLNITDLHIYNAIFGSVSHSGEMFYANDENGPWYPITTPTGLPSSREDEVDVEDIVSGLLSPDAYDTFSGIMARAVIIDKNTNSVKFGVDNWSGMNTGDYFLTHELLRNSGSSVVSSGIIASGSGSGDRGWILEYDPFTGDLVGGLGSGIYPIMYSGNYSMKVLDLENDGINDYVSVRTTGGTSIPFNDIGYDFGSRTASPTYQTSDLDTRVSFNTLSFFDDPGRSFSANLSTAAGIVSVFDNESIDEREILYTASSVLHRRKLTRTFNVGLQEWQFTSASVDSGSYTISGKAPICIRKVSTDLYNIFFLGAGTSFGNGQEISYKQWNTFTNVLSSETIILTLTMPDNAYHTTTTEKYDNQYIIIDNIIYLYSVHFISNGFPSIADPDFALKANNYIEIYTASVNMDGLSGSGGGLVFTQNFNTGDQTIPGQQWQITGYTNLITPQVRVFQDGEVPHFVMLLQEWANPSSGAAIDWRNWVIYARDGTSFNSEMVQQTFVDNSSTFVYNYGSSVDSNFNPNIAAIQLTKEHLVMYVRHHNTGAALFYNGDSITPAVVSSIAWQLVENNIYPMWGEQSDLYIAKNGSAWYFVNGQTFSPQTQVTFPAGYSITKPFSTSDSVSPNYYWYGLDNLSQRVLLRTDDSSVLQTGHPINIASMSANRGFVCGNYFVDFQKGGGQLRYTYLNNDTDVPQGVTYLLLQREGLEYNLIREAGKPIRVDISNNSPILSVLDMESTFKSAYVYGNEVTQIIPTSGLQQREVRDYRYSLLETADGEVTTDSGFGISSQIVYVHGSGIYTSDVATYSGGFVVMEESTTLSGQLERIETTNYTYPGQYIFVTTSGENPEFYQKDNDGLFFLPYSGLPSSRATIIRIDDRM